MYVASDTFITAHELHELTGYKLPRSQFAWLRKHGWKFAETAGHRPKVTREYFSARLGAVAQQTSICRAGCT